MKFDSKIIFLYLYLVIPGHLLNGYLDIAFVTLVALIQLAKVLMSKATMPKGIFNFILAISFSGLILTLLHASDSSKPVLIQDIYFVIKPIIILLNFYFLFDLVLKKDFLNRIINLNKIIIVFSILGFFSLFFHLPFLKNIYNLYGLNYGGKTVIEGLIIRNSIPFSNPNFLSGFMILAMCLFTIGRSGIIWKFLVFIVTLSTGSRTGVLGFLIFVILTHLSSIKKLLTVKNIILTFSSILILIFIISRIDIFNYNNIFNRYIDFYESIGSSKSIGSMESLDARLDIYKDVLNLISENLIFGVGSTYFFIEVIDNYFLEVLLSYGLVITIISLIYFSYVTYRFFPKKSKHLFTPLILTMIFFNMTGSYFENVRLFVFFLILLHVTKWNIYNNYRT